MAEIKIEKKSSAWIWIIVGLIILALLLYFLVFRDNDDDNLINVNETEQVITDTTRSVESSATNTPLNQYLGFADTEGEMGLSHSYSSSGLVKLIEAIRFKAQEANVDINADLDKANTLALDIKEDPMSTIHAAHIREAASITATAMQTLQKAKFPGLEAEVNQLQESVKGIDPGTQTLNQRDAVKSFFKNAAQVLRKM